MHWPLPKHNACLTHPAAQVDDLERQLAKQQTQAGASHADLPRGPVRPSRRGSLEASVPHSSSERSSPPDTPRLLRHDVHESASALLGRAEAASAAAASLEVKVPQVGALHTVSNACSMPCSVRTKACQLPVLTHCTRPDAVCQAQTQGDAGTQQQSRSPSAPLASVPMSATRVIMHQIVLPGEVDQAGVCFGGQVCATLKLSSEQQSDFKPGLRELQLALVCRCRAAQALQQSLVQTSHLGLCAGAELDRHLRWPGSQGSGQRPLCDGQPGQRALLEALPPGLSCHHRCHGARMSAAALLCWPLALRMSVLQVNRTFATSMEVRPQLEPACTLSCKPWSCDQSCELSVPAQSVQLRDSQPAWPGGCTSRGRAEHRGASSGACLAFVSVKARAGPKLQQASTVAHVAGGCTSRGGSAGERHPFAAPTLPLSP